MPEKPANATPRLANVASRRSSLIHESLDRSRWRSPANPGPVSGDAPKTQTARRERAVALTSTDYGITGGLGCSFAAHNPLLKSVNSTKSFRHGIAFMTNGALGVYPVGSKDLNTATSRL